MPIPHPRFFVPRGDPAPMPPPRAELLVQLRDTFRLGAGGPQAVVGVDRKGRLQVVTTGIPTALPTALRERLAHHELTGGPLRTVDAAELWLFDPQLVEQAVNTPGANDPVQLHGALFGPFDGVSAPHRVDGSLTVTRADVLAGFLDELPYAFHVSGPNGDAERSLHVLLPGDTADALAAGSGVVLAWPAIPTEIDAEDVANEAMCKGLLFDLLAAMQVDLRDLQPDAPFAQRTLPIPSRPDLERELESEGWEIKGDTAVRLDASLKKGFGSLLTSVLGVPNAMRRTLPPEGRLDEFIAVAREALQDLPGWPDARSQTLRARVRAADSPVRAVTPRPPPEPGPPPRPSPPRPIPDPPRPATPTWQGDFPTSPATPPLRPPTRVTTLGGREVPRGIPDWMKDFKR